MPNYDHLPLTRLQERLPRRKKPGFGSTPPRDFRAHGSAIKAEVEAIVAAHKELPRIDYVNPSLILRVQMSGALLEEDWERAGLTVLSTDEDRTLVLFASDAELRDFRQRVEAYQGGPAKGANPPYAGFLANIENVGVVEPRDRIGKGLREAGFTDADHLLAEREYVLDLELWDLGRQDLRSNKVDEIARYVGTQAGEVLDRYVGASITLMRIRALGSIMRMLLTVSDVAELDLPPEPDLLAADLVDLTLAQVSPLNPPDDGAPAIGILDTGSVDHPLMVGAIAGAIGVPDDLGTNDAYGHGMKVAGIAALGDVRAGLADSSLKQDFRLCTAKVLNDQGKFDNRRLIPSLMRDAIGELHATYGSRIYVVSLGDRSRAYDGGKVGTWAATLDELARDLDVVIVVSAGNGTPPYHRSVERSVSDYPAYLLVGQNRLFAPAMAANVLTVGAIANGPGLPGGDYDQVQVQPITQRDEPSPFTRIGPGVGGSVKPDLCDYGGTLVFDGVTQSLKKGAHWPSAGVLTLNHRPLEHLFTADSGTSFSAPMVAYKAGHILRRFPNVSANLIRALLGSSAQIPENAAIRIQPYGEVALRNVCGYGRPDLARSLYSDDDRVVLYADEVLDIDHFAVFEIPIVDEFRRVPGRRQIKIALAFDPPVRHSRSDYLGTRMSYRLVRGQNSDFIFEHYRQRTKAEGRVPELRARFVCNLEPGPNLRDKGTMQVSSFTFERNVDGYGDRYYLVVRCEGQWAANFVARQRYAVVVEMSHKAEQVVQLYQRIRQRVRLPA
jgi:hypothetical protein